MQCKIPPVYITAVCGAHAIFQNSLYLSYKLTLSVFSTNEIFYEEYGSVEGLRLIIYCEIVFLFPFDFFIYIFSHLFLYLH